MQVFRRVLAISLSVALLASGTPAHALSRVQAVSFIDENTGYIGGWYPTQKGFVSHTSDGGASWTATSTGSYPVSGIAAGPAGAWATFGIYSNKALTMTNPGLQWTLGEAIYSRAVPGRLIRLASGRLVAVGQLTDYYVSGSGWHGRVAFIATSDDSGDSWQLRSAGPLYAAQSIDSDPPKTWASMADVDVSPDGSTLWAVGNEWNASGSTATTLKRRLAYRSTDDGSTWTLQTVPGTTALNCVTAASGTVAYSFGQLKGGVKTTNGGSTWAAITAMPTFISTIGNASITSADSVDANTVLLVGNKPHPGGAAQIARSADGGATWSVFPDLGVDLYGLQMLSSTHGIVVGANEAISRTADGGASWTFPDGPQAPWITRSQPAQNFSFANPVTVSGTSNDGKGVGVERVDVRIRRADGWCWNGVSWVSGESWVRASTANGWKNWSHTWEADASLLAAPQIVTVTARATDGVGFQRLSTSASSRVEISAAISIDDGASFTNQTTVPVSVSAPGAVNMRWRVEGGATGDWMTYSTDEPVQVPLGGVEGMRTVWFDFAGADTSSISAQARDDIFVDLTGPPLTVAVPSEGFSIQGQTPIAVRAVASDTGGSPVDAVEFAVERTDGSFSDGVSAWTTDETWMPATKGADGSWSASWLPHFDETDEGQHVSVRFRASDLAGNLSEKSVQSAVRDTVAPVLSIASPAPGQVLTASQIQIAGSATDVTTGVSTVEYSLLRSDGRYWTGAAWGAQTWLPIAATSGSGAWSVAWSPQFELLESGHSVTLVVRTIDGMGHISSLTRQLSAPAERRPDIVISSPGSGYYITNSTIRTVSGWVSDALSGVSTVDLSIKRSDGYYWSGGSWVAGERWIPVPYTAGSPTWSTTWRPDAALVRSGRAVEIRARARDAFGNERQSGAVTSTRRTKASMSRPTLSSRTIRRGRTYRATGSLKPRHTAGTKPVKIYAYRYVRGKYRYYRAFSATASNYSSYTKYTAKVRLPYRGKWRLRAVHSDTQHLKSYSSYRYVTVR